MALHVLILVPLGILKVMNRLVYMCIISHGDSPWFAAVSGFVGSKVGSRILNNVIDCHICRKCSVELQHNTDSIERERCKDFGSILDEISAAKESLNAL